ncbi:hypothetical protein BH11GEM2_BH11GEM2_00910 [soil metagenome]
MLIVVFMASIPFSLHGDKPAEIPPKSPAGSPPEKTEPARARWPMSLAITLLSVAGIAAAFASEWFVDAMLPTTHALGISEAFTGFVIVAIAGNAVENVVAIQLAAKNKPIRSTRRDGERVARLKSLPTSPGPS